jgi:hypothetical protein
VPVPLAVMVAGPLPAASKISVAEGLLVESLRIVLLELELVVTLSEPTVKLHPDAGQGLPEAPSVMVRVPVALGKMAAAPIAFGTVPSVHWVESPQAPVPLAAIQFSACNWLAICIARQATANEKNAGLKRLVTTCGPPEKCRINRSSAVETWCSIIKSAFNTFPCL